MSIPAADSCYVSHSTATTSRRCTRNWFRYKKWLTLRLHTVTWRCGHMITQTLANIMFRQTTTWRHCHGLVNLQRNSVPEFWNSKTRSLNHSWEHSMDRRSRNRRSILLGPKAIDQLHTNTIRWTPCWTLAQLRTLEVRDVVVDKVSKLGLMPCHYGVIWKVVLVAV